MMVFTIEASNWCKGAPSLLEDHWFLDCPEPEKLLAHRNSPLVKTALILTINSSKMPTASK
jgi:hypothetical protein